MATSPRSGPAIRTLGSPRSPCTKSVFSPAARLRASRCPGSAAPSLDVRGFRRRSWFSLRWVITHMIEEYARHNGHADLLRERLDGSTGEYDRQARSASGLTPGR